MVAYDIFVCTAVVQLLQPPFFRVVSDRCLEYGEYLVTVMAVIVGFEFRLQALSVLLHRAEDYAVFGQIATFGEMGQDIPFGCFGSFA